MRTDRSSRPSPWLAVAAAIATTVVIHAGAGLGLALIEAPEEEPPCPTQIEMCVERCRWDREPFVPSRCEARRPCSCELVELEPPPIMVVAPMLPSLVEPPSAVEPPPPPEPPPAPPVAEKTAALEPARDTKSSRASGDANVEAAKSASIAKVLGTYGKPSAGTVFDVMESTDNNLGDLFAEGMVETTDGVGHGSLEDGGGIKVAGGGSDGHVSQGKSAQPKPEVTSTGIVDPDALRAQVMRHGASVRGCHERALKTDPTLAGTLTLTLELSEGRVTSTKVHDEGLGSSSVIKCVRAKAARWRFKKTVSGSVEVSFVLSSG